MITLTQEQAAVLEALCDSFELYMTGPWPYIEDRMHDDFGIEHPESALEDARRAIRGES